jgi:hypothetical protein
LHCMAGVKLSCQTEQSLAPDRSLMAKCRHDLQQRSSLMAHCPLFSALIFFSLMERHTTPNRTRCSTSSALAHPGSTLPPQSGVHIQDKHHPIDSTKNRCIFLGFQAYSPPESSATVDR